jgi:hypothetical protein
MAATSASKKLTAKEVSNLSVAGLKEYAATYTRLILITRRDLNDARKRSKELSKLLKQFKKEAALIQARLLKLK